MDRQQSEKFVEKLAKPFFFFFFSLAFIKVQDEKEICSRNERAINLVVSLYRTTAVPLAHWKLSPITGRLFYSNGACTPPFLPWNGANVVRVMITGGKLLEILCAGNSSMLLPFRKTNLLRIYNAIGLIIVQLFIFQHLSRLFQIIPINLFVSILSIQKLILETWIFD